MSAAQRIDRIRRTMETRERNRIRALSNVQLIAELRLSLVGWRKADYTAAVARFLVEDGLSGRRDEEAWADALFFRQDVMPAHCPWPRIYSQDMAEML